MIHGVAAQWGHPEEVPPHQCVVLLGVRKGKLAENYGCLWSDSGKCAIGIKASLPGDTYLERKIFHSIILNSFRQPPFRFSSF